MGQCFADLLLVAERSVRLGGIEHHDPTLEGCADERDRFATVELRAVAGFSRPIAP
jgi:hypothetical protein